MGEQRDGDGWQLRSLCPTAWAKEGGVLRGATQMQGTGHVKGPVESCHLTLASAAHIGWKGEGSSIILEQTLLCSACGFVVKGDGVEPAGETQKRS